MKITMLFFATKFVWGNSPIVCIFYLKISCQFVVKRLSNIYSSYFNSSFSFQNNNIIFLKPKKAKSLVFLHKALSNKFQRQVLAVFFELISMTKFMFRMLIAFKETNYFLIVLFFDFLFSLLTI